MRNELTTVAVMSGILAGCATEPTIRTEAHELAFTIQPTNANVGTPIAPAVVVSVQDISGNVVTSATTPITVGLGNNAAGATLTGTLTASAVGGAATFSDLTVSQAGSGYTLTASAPNLVGATSGTFDITTPILADSTRVLLTDDPFPYDRIERVDIYFVSVSASLTPDTSAAANFMTLAEPNRRINVLALQGGVTDELGAVVLPTGVITAVRVVIDTDSSSMTLKDGRVLNGTSTPGIAWQLSAGRPTLNALIHEQIAVPDSGAIVAIVYDVGKAFIPTQVVDPTSTDSGFIFSPVLSAADARRTGSIAGTVRADSAGGNPIPDASLQLYLGNPANPENTWSTLATARADVDGAFRFSYVMPSAHWLQFPAHAGSTYIVAVDPPSGSAHGRLLVPNVQVIMGEETVLGVLILP